MLGHGSTGKTGLAESILFINGTTDRLGKVTDGNTVSDYDAEEIKRQISISASMMYTEYKGNKVNLLDTPGFFDFAGEVSQAVRVADAAVIVCAAKCGLSVGTEKAWDNLTENNMPKAIYVSKIDEENGDFYGLYEALKEKYGHSICPMVIPFSKGEKVEGVIDIVLRKAYSMDKGKCIEVPLPDDMQSVVDDMYTVLTENVAETSEEFMDKYFSGDPFTAEEMAQGISMGIRTGSLVPVVCGSAFTGLGTELLLNIIVNFFPSPMESKPENALDAGGNAVKIEITTDSPVCLLIFKTTSDQYGKFSFFKVISGKVESDMMLLNPRTGTTEKMGHIYIIQGKKNIEVKELHCGEIGSVSKLS